VRTLVLNGLRLGGARTALGRYIEILARQWSLQDIPFDRIRILVPQPTQIEGQLSDRIEVISPPGPSRPLAAWEQFTLPRAAAGAAVLFCPGYIAPVVGSTPLVVANHGIYEGIPGEFSLLQRMRTVPLYRAAVRNADAVIAVCVSARADIIRYLGADPAKIAVIHAAPDPRFLRRPGAADIEVAVTRALGTAAPYVLFVGKLSRRRNVPALVEAFADVRRDGDLPHRLLIVGPVADTERVRGLAERHGVADAVVHINHLEHRELALLYAGADVFALPTTHEGFSWTILEAMASGAPVLTADHASLHEKGVATAAAVVPEPTPAALAAALRRLLTDPDLRRRHSEAGRAVVAGLSWARTAAETMAVLDRVGAPADARRRRGHP
jgi:glycosyltransferase involved in cell wall biosynthesis